MTQIDRLNAFLTTEKPWLTDGGLETELIFTHGIDLPSFASLYTFDSTEGRAALAAYYDSFVDTAIRAGTGFMIDTATWRSGGYWGEALGETTDRLIAANRAAVEAARAVEARIAGRIPTLINGTVGPAGDGYAPDRLYDADTAQAIHADQVGWLKEAGVDMISAVTMTHPGEAIGFLRAARAAGMPAAVSFTVETDGHLPNGQSLADAIEETDAAAEGYALYFMINCAHPDHFKDRLSGDWLARIGGIRANASRMSHAELDAAEELDPGDASEFGALHGDLARRLPALRVIGGCCGTCHDHVDHAARHVLAA